MQRYMLPPQLDIRHVADLQQALLTAGEGGPPMLDASAVERVDTAGVQLLASALLAEPRAAVGLSDTSAPLREALVALGLAEALLAEGGPPASDASH